MKIHSSTLFNYPNGISNFPTKLMNENHAERIHSQSLERLDERGGMSYGEIIVNIFGLGLSYLENNNDTKDQEELLRHIIECIKEPK